MKKINENFNNITIYIEQHGVLAKFIYALAILIIGWIVINLVVNIIGKVLTKRNFDKTLQPFIKSLLTWLLRIALFISVAGVVGVETASFIAILGAVGFAIGMAMQGALGNLAGGALILIFRPYKVGDLIESQGRLGVVKEIQIFTTILLSPENKTIILPNGPVANNDIVNYTVEGVIRVDCSVGIAYDENIPKAKKVLFQVLENDPDVLKSPKPFVGVEELAGSSVNLAVRPYTKPEKYWDVFFRVNENMKVALDNADIEIPFSQLDVSIKK